MSKKLFWERSQVSASLADALELLGREYPLYEGKGECQLRFQEGAALSVAATDNCVTVTSRSLTEALRGTGLALAGIECADEALPFQQFGVMVDLSRNAVMTPAAIKALFCKLALTGYNTALLYLEDTYILPDEPHFGYLRGGYTCDEIRELDDFAHTLGIELVGCIQTLGHLATFLRTAGAAPVKDTASVLMLREEKTYELIRKMINFWSTACRSRRIHVGMDEAHDLGRGNFLDKHGFCRYTDLFNSHLNRVTEICAQSGLSPMIWSDMYFRICSAGGDYFEPDTVIPPEVCQAVPPAVKLVYWDYSHTEPEHYAGMLAAHQVFQREIAVAGGIWTWYRITYDHQQTIDRMTHCLDMARAHGIKEFFFTIWGDDGAYCDFDSAFAGLLWGADRAYGNAGDDTNKLERLSQALGSKSYAQAVLASQINYQSPRRENGVGTLSILLWDDPLLGIGWRELELDDPEMQDAFLAALNINADALPDYPYAVAAAAFLTAKIHLRRTLLAAYKERNLTALRALRLEEIPQILTLLEDLSSQFRKQWLSRFKYDGLECIQLRFGGLAARYRELSTRLQELEEQVIDAIPELELTRDPRCQPARKRYQEIAYSGVL